MIGQHVHRSTGKGCGFKRPLLKEYTGRKRSMTCIPTQFDRAMAMWREIDFPFIALQTEEFDFINELRAVYSNGEVLHRSFSIPDHPDLAVFINSGTLHSTYFFERFWQTKSVAKALPYTLNDIRFLSPDTFRWIHPVELPGSFASALLRGGAYTTKPMPARSAMKIAELAAEVFLAGDFDSPRVFVSCLPWSTFFHDVAWDYTWLIIRPDNKRIEVVLATDTD
jgi:hypothetical protein